MIRSTRSRRCRARCAASVLVLAGLFAAPAAAQVTERPVAFDDAQRVVAITPALASRLRLQPPAWPVTGDFREARLHQSGGAFVLVVTRMDDAVDRYPLDAAAAAALRSAVATGMRRAGQPSGEPGSDVLSEPAGFAFARNQLILGAALYGPLAAGLVGGDDGSAAGAAYLLTAGLPFFAALAVSRHEPITRAQNTLATDGAWRLAAIATTALYAATDTESDDAYLATALGGAAAGTVVGLRLGRRLTDGEARAMTATSSWTAAIAAGALGMAGRFDDDCRTVSTVVDYGDGPITLTDRRCDSRFGRGEAGTLAVAALVGYPLGLQYVRRAPYALTAGDINATFASGLVGALAATALLPEDGDRRSAQSAIITGGLVAGLVAGDRLLARRFDYSRGQGTLLGVGALGGATLGLAVPVLARTDDGRAFAGAAAAGAALGMWATHRLVDPRPAGARGPSRQSRTDRDATRRSASRSSAPRVQLDPAAAALAATGTRGQHSILRLTF